MSARARQDWLRALAAGLVILGLALFGCGGKQDDSGTAGGSTDGAAAGGAGGDLTGDEEDGGAPTTAPPPPGPALPPSGGAPVPVSPTAGGAVPAGVAEAGPALPPGPKKGPAHGVRRDPFAPLDQPLKPVEEEAANPTAVTLLPIRASIQSPPQDQGPENEGETDTLPITVTGVVWGAVIKAILRFENPRPGEPESQVVKMGDRVTVNVRGRRELIVQSIQPSGVRLRDPLTGQEFFCRRGEG